MWMTKKRLEADIGRWRGEGWVTPAGHDRILEELKKGAGPSLSGALSILAAVLLGFGAMSFVAANWQDMPRIARLAVLFSGLLASYGTAGVLFQRNMDTFGHAATLLGTALFGASIMLISQMFHMDGNPADAVLVWAAGTLLTGVLVRSNPTLAFAMVLVSVWGGIETAQIQSTFWPYLLGWGAVAAAFYWMRWRPGIHVAGAPLTAFLISIGYTIGDGRHHELVTLIGIALAGLAIAGDSTLPGLKRLFSGMLGYAIVITLAGLLALQFSHTIPVAQLVVLAVLTLGLLIAAIWWGMHTGHRGALWIGYTGFSIEILMIYAEKLGNLLDTSLFFLVAGLIVAGLAYMALKLRNEVKEIRTCTASSSTHGPRLRSRLPCRLRCSSAWSGAASSFLGTAARSSST